ncbi:MAG TPA: hypothetical protein VIY68_12895 [Steroidobacteraceae bacterium]
MKRQVSLVSIGLAGILLWCGARLGIADEAAPKNQFFSSYVVKTPK